MNSGSLSETKRRAVKKVVFLVGLMLLILACAATPLTAFACAGGGNNDGGNNGGGNKGGGNKDGGGGAKPKGNKQPPANPNAASTERADLEANKEAFEDVNGKPLTAIEVTALKGSDKFKIVFKDLGDSVDAIVVIPGKGDGNLVGFSAKVTLSDGTQVICRVVSATKASVTAVPNSNSTKEFAILFPNVPQSSWLLFTLKGVPLAKSAIKKAGQKFEVKKAGSNTVMQALYLGPKNPGEDLVLVSGILHHAPTLFPLGLL